MKLGADARVAAANPDTIEKLDAWENRWFPIAAATLERRFPAVHAQVFKNLSQTTGPAVAVSVRTFIDRFDEMSAGAGTYGPEGSAALAMLRSRGLTDTIVSEARVLLDTVGKAAPLELDAIVVEADKDAIAKAEADLWAWYLEWSQIARIAITQRALLKQMGFAATRSKSSGAGAHDEDGEDDGDAPPAPNGQPVLRAEH